MRPLKLGHVVIGSTDYAATSRFFTEGLGFKASDYITPPPSFLHPEDLAALMTGSHAPA